LSTIESTFHPAHQTNISAHQTSYISTDEAAHDAAHFSTHETTNTAADFSTYLAANLTNRPAIASADQSTNSTADGKPFVAAVDLSVGSAEQSTVHAAVNGTDDTAYNAANAQASFHANFDSH
jgi:hypothetical protein